MKTLTATLQGRFGNQTLQWLFAYAFARTHGFDFRCGEWIGERIFALPAYGRPNPSPMLPRYNEKQIADNLHDRITGESFEYRGYAQTQFCVSYYTKRQAQGWLKLRPEIEEACQSIPIPKACAHIRAGDYVGYGYPVVHSDAYYKACEEFGIDGMKVEFIREDTATWPVGIPDDISFVADFYRMMRTKTLLRGNSSFSWLAALLGDGLVLSPVIDGLEGGKEHYCRFVAGNHPKFANLDFVEDLYVAP